NDGNTNGGMLLDMVEFFLTQPARFQQDVIPDTNLAHVVETAGDEGSFDIPLAPANAADQPGEDLRDPFGVSAGVVVSGFKGVHQTGDAGEEKLLFSA